MYNTWSGPVAHHKARAEGREADNPNSPPCRELQGTLDSICHAQELNSRQFSVDDCSPTHRQFCDLIAVSSEGGMGSVDHDVRLVSKLADSVTDRDARC